MSSGRILAERWLASRLAALNCPVNRHPAPESTELPNVTIGLRTGTDLRGISDPSRVERLVYDVSAWDEGESASAVNNLAVSIHNLLEGVAPVTVTDGVILSCRRVGVVPIDKVIEDGKTYQRDGSLFQIDVYVSP